MSLEGKVALVTGAADNRSIGWGIAEALASAGADLAVNDHPSRESELADRVSDIEKLGQRGLAVAADVSQSAQVDQMFSETTRQLGRIDIVVSNAGIIRWEHLLDITTENFRAIVDVNLKGNMLVCQSGAKRLIEQGRGGRIIITSSVQAYAHFPITPVYGGTKHAMHIFVGALALELASYQITVNHLGPGWLRTALNDHAPGQQTTEDLVKQRQAVPLRRDGQIQEVGAAAAYFASDDAAYTTGAYLPVDGGLGISKYSY